MCLSWLSPLYEPESVFRLGRNMHTEVKMLLLQLDRIVQLELEVGLLVA